MITRQNMLAHNKKCSSSRLSDARAFFNLIIIGYFLLVDRIGECAGKLKQSRQW